EKLESKLASLAAAQQQALVENDGLKQALHIISTENDILRAISQINVKDHHSLVPAIFDSSQYYANFAPTDDLKNSSTSTISKDGERLLDAGAAWDFINHKLFKKGLVDVGDMSE
ncbi:hypothetical protein BGZ63DRAFT_173327, partial [Mariannaea sp. PMI_226]